MKISRRKFLQIIPGSYLSLMSFPILNLNKDVITLPNESTPDLLFESFRNPDNKSKPFVRWWWNGNLIEKKEIIRELDLLKEVGIGGVEINAIRFPGDNDLGIAPLKWLSKEWIEMVKMTVGEAKHRDITCDIIVGSGWPFGGDFLGKEEQTQVLSFSPSYYKLDGPGTIQFSKQQLLERIHGEQTEKEIFSIRMVPSYMDEFDPGIDLTNQFKNDILTIDIPYYVEQELFVIVKETGKQKVTLGAPGASGPVLNHFNKSAVSKYLDRMSDEFNKHSNGLGSLFRSMFCDSLELSGHAWCDDFLEEFHTRRGYSLAPYLPFILSDEGVIKMGEAALEVVRRARYDYVVTKQELFTERFLCTFQDWCTANQVKSRVQAYGIGYHPLESSMIVDIPECETWLGNHNGIMDHHGFTSINKFVASAAKLSGKELVSCEEITNISHVFFATLEEIKITGDQSNLSGVNHSVLHGFNYSPLKAGFPGWVRWGTYFNEHNTWWPFLKHWISYKTRLSAVLQKATPRTNIAILHPLADIWMEYGQQFQPTFGWGQKYPWYQYDLWYAIHQNGNTCDYISEKIITQSEIRNSKIEYNGCAFNTIMLMEVKSIARETAEKLAEFAQKGGHIIFIGCAPEQCPGLVNYKQNDNEVKKTILSIIKNYPSKCKIVKSPQNDLLKWVQELQEKNDLMPPVKIQNPNHDISLSQYTYEDKEIYFFINSSRSDTHSITAEFNTNKTPWIWNPETGERHLYPYNNQKNKLSIELSPAESKLIIFDNNDENKLPKREMKLTLSSIINEDWDVELSHVNGSSEKIKLEKLFDFKEDSNLKTFAGNIIYKKTLKKEIFDSVICIDLGKVYGISEVLINNISIGCRWYGKHVYNCEQILKKNSGDIQLIVKVTTVIGNYCKSLKDNKTSQNWTKNHQYVSNGLIGPVRLLKKL